jgi:hypothetical protein
MRNPNQNPGMLPAGLYYVGDLYYLPKEIIGDWTKLCENFHPDNKPEQSGVFTDENGTKFANFNTFYGDGLFCDADEDVYYVDSGSIGCYPIESRKQVEDCDGQVVAYDEEFDCEYIEDGTIRFGFIEIYTGYNDGEGDWVEIEEEDIETESSEVSQ